MAPFLIITFFAIFNKYIFCMGEYNGSIYNMLTYMTSFTGSMINNAFFDIPLAIKI